MEKKHLKISFTLSFLTHILIFAILVALAFFTKKEISFYENGGGKGMVWVDLEPIGSGFTVPPSDSVKKINPSKNKEKKVTEKIKSPENDDALKLRQKKTTENLKEESGEKSASGTVGEGSGKGSGLGEGKGLGTGEGSGASPSSVLGLIRKKIEQSKHYPLLAKNRKIEGVAVLSFSIQTSGAVENLKLVQSSGSELLDNEALATVQRAAPLPYYAQPIKISIRFNLE